MNEALQPDPRARAIKYGAEVAKSLFKPGEPLPSLELVTERLTDFPEGLGETYLGEIISGFKEAKLQLDTTPAE